MDFPNSEVSIEASVATEKSSDKFGGPREGEDFDHEDQVTFLCILLFLS